MNLLNSVFCIFVINPNPNSNCLKINNHFLNLCSTVYSWLFLLLLPNIFSNCCL